jgi:hypothetical protein
LTPINSANNTFAIKKPPSHMNNLFDLLFIVNYH